MFGYPSQKADAPDFTVKGDVSQPPVPFMENGAYLVFRRLAQLVPEFDLAVKLEAAQTGGASDKASPDLLGAQMVGRWKSGAPIINAPTADDPLLAEGTPNVNDFEFGSDRNGLVCPWPWQISARRIPATMFVTTRRQARVRLMLRRLSPRHTE